jgi:citrate lyase subunit beta/citryl-CoA lyase
VCDPSEPWSAHVDTLLPMAPSPTSRLRSVLYIPGANERALQKAPGLSADALILDLEDAVAPAAKPEARERVCRMLTEGAFGSVPVTIRANGIGTEWHEEDLRAIAAAGPDAVLVPKVGSAHDVHRVERLLESLGAPQDTAVWAMLETPAAVLRAAEIADASERLTVLVMGTNDLARELFAELAPGREPLLGSLSLCLLGARAAGKTILDGVWNDVRDLEGFEEECRQGRRFGFDGKTLIHPGQVEICNRAFSPSEEEVARARRVIEAFEEAERDGRGVVTVDGRMIENLHVASARRTLALADAGTGVG